MRPTLATKAWYPGYAGLKPAWAVTISQISVKDTQMRFVDWELVPGDNRFSARICANAGKVRVISSSIPREWIDDCLLSGAGGAEGVLKKMAPIIENKYNNGCHKQFKEGPIPDENCRLVDITKNDWHSAMSKQA